MCQTNCRKQHPNASGRLRDRRRVVGRFTRVSPIGPYETQGVRVDRSILVGIPTRGVAREQARKDLPLCIFTEAYWKIDLHNLLHFLHLRMDIHAQVEIRRYAETIGREIVRPLFPITWEAFEDYRLGAIHLTRLDAGVISRLSAAGKVPANEEDFMAAQDPDLGGAEALPGTG